MKLLVAILAILRTAWFAACYSFDLKNSLISGNVAVHHGYFMKNGKYVMLMGYEQPIRKVTFGETVLLPEKGEDEKDQEYLVEIFENTSYKFAEISCFKKCEEETCYQGSQYLIIIPNRALKIEKGDFMKVLESPVWLYFDVKPGRKHPYMESEVKEKSYFKIVEYRIGKSYKNKEINEKEGVQYRMGTAYDSSTDAMVGFKLFKKLMNKFDSVIMEYRLRLNSLTFKDGRRKVKYNYTKYYCRNVWKSEITMKEDFDELAKWEAYEMPKILKQKGVLISPIIIDISETISPKAFSLEKTVGRAGSWEYTLYQVPIDNMMNFKINKIIDTKAEEMEIWTPNVNAEETTVEIYKYMNRWIIIATSYIPNTLDYTKVTTVLDRNNREGKIVYRELIGDEKKFALETLRLIIPISIEVSLNEEPTRIYDKEVRLDRNGKYIYLTINEIDGRAIDDVRKYSFGNITQKLKYEAGNIPKCNFQNEEVLSRLSLNNRNIIITNSLIPQDLKHLELEKYEIVYRKDLE